MWVGRLGARQHTLADRPINDWPMLSVHHQAHMAMACALSPLTVPRERGGCCEPGDGGPEKGARTPTGTEGTDDVGPSAPVWKDGAVGVAPASLPPTPSSLGENDKLEPGNQDPSDSGGPLTALIQYEVPQWADTLPIIISSRSRTIGPALARTTPSRNVAACGRDDKTADQHRPYCL